MSLRVVGALGARLAVVLLVLSGCSSGSNDGGGAPAPPRRLPEITLASFDGAASLDLSTVRGPAVVNLWASWCEPCRRELPDYQAFSQKYAGKVKVIGIDFQDPQQGKARELIKQTGVTFPLYRDPDGLMRARGLPQLILIDEEGRRAFEQYVEVTSLKHLETLVEKHLGELR